MEPDKVGLGMRYSDIKMLSATVRSGMVLGLKKK